MKFKQHVKTINHHQATQKKSQKNNEKDQIMGIMKSVKFRLASLSLSFYTSNHSFHFWWSFNFFRKNLWPRVNSFHHEKSGFIIHRGSILTLLSFWNSNHPFDFVCRACFLLKPENSCQKTRKKSSSLNFSFNFQLFYVPVKRSFMQRADCCIFRVAVVYTLCRDVEKLKVSFSFA